MDISIVVPLLNEEESLPELVAWIDRVMKANQLTYEIMMIDDGSTDTSWQVVQQLATQNPNIRGVKFRRNYGKSAALNEGFSRVKGDVVITMDADLQDSPDEVPELHRMVMEDGFDVVSGWKKKRHDPLNKTIPSKFYNATTRWMSGIQLNDFNCGLKAYRNAVVKNIEVYGEMHRYIPIIAKAAGFPKIGEKVVEHRARKFGVTKFGWERVVRGFLDLMSISFVSKFGKRPMHFFGTWGTVLFFIGFAILTFLSVEKLFYSEYGMTTRPIFFFGILSFIVGTQLFLAGFLAEMIARTSPNRNQYFVESELEND